MKMSKAVVVAVAFEIWCPDCLRDDPIPATDGSFMWDRIPESVTCPDCRKMYLTAKKVITPRESS